MIEIEGVGVGVGVGVGDDVAHAVSDIQAAKPLPNIMANGFRAANHCRTSFSKLRLPDRSAASRPRPGITPPMARKLHQIPGR